MRLSKTKKGQSSLLSYFSTDTPSKKKRFEDKAPEGVVLEHELEPNVEDVSGSSYAQSTATTKHIAPMDEIQRPSCSSSSTSQLEIGLINKRDPAHGPKGKNNAEDVFTLIGFSKWKKAVKVFEKHEKSNSHQSNNIKLNCLKEANKSSTVIEKVNQKYSEEVQENRLYLEALCESLIFCGRQSIALRGHDESTDSKNRGNFLELMKLRSKDNSLIKKFFMEHRKHFQFTSATFQNELLSIIGEQIKFHIAKEVKEAEVFAIIADETQDIAKHEQVAIVLRYVNEKLEVHESFVGFYRAKRTDGKTLANELKNVLISMDLNIKNLRAQCYDGASNMRGPYKRVAAIIMQEAPMAMYTHCNAHILNLCIVTCCTRVPSIRNTFFKVFTTSLRNQLNDMLFLKTLKKVSRALVVEHQH
ncbi:hypothetical protein QTP88_010838 [Uroleucon formosanum]